MYRERGADTWLPFSSDLKKVTTTTSLQGNTQKTITIEGLTSIRMARVVFQNTYGYIGIQPEDGTYYVGNTNGYANLGIRSINGNQITLLWDGAITISFDAWGI